MKLYPVLLNLKGKNILVVGAGNVGVRKIKGLLNTGCNITVMAENQEKLKQVLTEKKLNKDNLKEDNNSLITFVNKDFDIGIDEYILLDKKIIFICTNDKKVNDYISLKAKELGILYLRADEGKTSDFINPSVIEKDKLIISISSSGNSPVYSKLLKGIIEDIISDLDTENIQLMGSVREKIKNLNIKDNEKRELLKRLPFMNKEELKSYENNCGNKG